MSMATRIVYPESDGEPMAENTVQYDWISLLKWNIEVLFRDRDDVFVAGDNFIYPVEGDPKIRLAPDVYVAFGRPKGDRGSYKVWKEGGIFPQVIVEVLSPSNRPAEMELKRKFYERHGAKEYYVLEPAGTMYLEGWRRRGGKLAPIPPDDIMDYKSPLLGVRFITSQGCVKVYGPDGKSWATPLVMIVEANNLTEKAEARAEEAIEQAEDAKNRADEAVERAKEAEEKLHAERQKAKADRQKLLKLAAKLRELGLDPNAD